MSYTPGPWNCNRVGEVVSAQHGMVADATTRPHTDERDANARLIAAAPELLAAAKFAAECLEKGASYERLTAAIAHTEGRG